MTSLDWETWLVEDAGHSVVERKALVGIEGLSDLELLTYCLWVADYGMRNAGDLRAAEDLYPNFQVEGAQLARKMGLVTLASAFALPSSAFEASYFGKFDEMCAEISSAMDASRGAN